MYCHLQKKTVTEMRTFCVRLGHHWHTKFSFTKRDGISAPSSAENYFLLVLSFSISPMDMNFFVMFCGWRTTTFAG